MVKCKKWTGGLSGEVQEWTGGLSGEVQEVDWWA